jgi:hypothetical protein
MLELAAALARSGIVEYWDHVERMTVNCLRETQFFTTPTFERMFRDRHADKGKRAEQCLARVKELQGGYSSLYPFNDRMMEHDKSWLLEDLKGASRRGEADLTVEVNAGECCPPSAVRGMHRAWRSTAAAVESQIFINLGLFRDAAACSVLPGAPADGTLRVLVKKPGTFNLRLPSWADRAQTAATRGGAKVELQWRGNYAHFPDAQAGEDISLSFTPLRTTQRLHIGDAPREEDYTVTWCGNWIEKVEPKGQHLPLYADGIAVEPRQTKGPDGE